MCKYYFTPYFRDKEFVEEDFFHMKDCHIFLQWQLHQRRAHNILSSEIIEITLLIRLQSMYTYRWSQL